MAAPPLVFEFLGIVFTAILYGLYCMIFGLYFQIQLKRKDGRKFGSVFPFALAAIFIFILSTALFIMDIITAQFNITMSVLNEDSLESTVEWMTIPKDVLGFSIDTISQLILLYRCWILWRRPLLMVIPCILSLAYLVTALTVVGLTIKFLAWADSLDWQTDIPDWYLSTAMALLFLSLGVNALVTTMIVYKIISVYHNIREFNTSIDQACAHGNLNGRRDIYPVISVMIESGLITFVAQLAQSIMYKYANNEYELIAGVYMLFGISSTVVLVRVHMDISYDHDTMTVNPTNSGLTPFKSRIDQTTINISESDEPVPKISV